MGKSSVPRFGFVAVVLLLGMGCGGMRAMQRPAASPDEAFYVDRCGRCHDAFPRHAYGKSEWPGVVARMRFEARLTEPEAKRLIEWLAKGEE